jgi:WhiB family redox-sensing transcriptional regulator
MSVYQLDESWQRKAACRGPRANLFFPPNHFEKKADRLNRERQAKAICATCPVAQQCLEYAVSIQEPFGVWGGLNEVERKELYSEEVI